MYAAAVSFTTVPVLVAPEEEICSASTHELSHGMIVGCPAMSIAGSHEHIFVVPNNSVNSLCDSAALGHTETCCS
jgi:hypothetical protein